MPPPANGHDHHSPPRQSSPLRVGATIAALALLLCGAYLLYRYHYPDGTPGPAGATAPEQGLSPAPPALVERSSPPPAIPDGATAAATTARAPLPELGASDTDFRSELAPLSDAPEWRRWLEGDNLIRRGVGFLDALSRGLVARKLLPLAAPGDFVATPAHGKIWLGAESYQRFDRFAGIIGGLDSARLAGLFHRLRPLLEEAYAELGYPADGLDDALVQAIDACLATPEITTPIELTPKIRGFGFADPALEALPAAQKQLLRMGPENLRVLKDAAHRLLQALVADTATTSPTDSDDPAAR